MGAAGFTVEEIDELLTRCQRSCKTCSLAKKKSTVNNTKYKMPLAIPSEFPQSTSSSVSLNFPSVSPSAINIRGARSEFPSILPSASSVTKMVGQKNISLLPKSACTDDPVYIDKYGFDCGFYRSRNLECSQLKHMGLSHMELQELIDACAATCRVDCPDEDVSTYDVDASEGLMVNENISCRDTPFYHDHRFGFSCRQYGYMSCGKLELEKIGLTEEEMDEVFHDCRKTCNKCSSKHNNLLNVLTHHSIEPPSRQANGYEKGVGYAEQLDNTVLMHTQQSELEHSLFGSFFNLDHKQSIILFSSLGGCSAVLILLAFSLLRKKLKSGTIDNMELSTDTHAEERIYKEYDLKKENRLEKEYDSEQTSGNEKKQEPEMNHELKKRYNSKRKHVFKKKIKRDKRTVEAEVKLGDFKVENDQSYIKNTDSSESSVAYSCIEASVGVNNIINIDSCSRKPNSARGKFGVQRTTSILPNLMDGIDENSMEDSD
uniref:Uncharacterized protein n=1 Tax=Corethron hystrix TaxID=216773 RepID=A0A7S1G270_9STRA|mmetsp:Transcript_7724/g.16771  ORF Transcript_7724/g.16771 Transcript_7724/m.16771 type:complete len:488 (+) Transcript_7724:422-1885(+)